MFKNKKSCQFISEYRRGMLITERPCIVLYFITKILLNVSYIKQCLISQFLAGYQPFYCVNCYMLVKLMCDTLINYNLLTYCIYSNMPAASI